MAPIQNFHDYSDFMEDCYPDVQEIQTKYLHAQDHFIGLLEALYENTSLQTLENHIEEICYALEVPYPKGRLKIRKVEYFQEAKTFMRQLA